MNEMIVAGILKNEPLFNITNEGKNRLEIRLELDRKEIGKKEQLTLVTYDDELIRSILKEELQKGDYFRSDHACFKTINYMKNKQFVCPHCQHVQEVHNQAEETQIVFHDYIAYQGLPIEKMPGVNQVYLLGVLDCDPIERQLPSGIPIAKYKLRVERGPEDVDYPYIVSFRQEAQSALSHLKKGDTVLVKGAIQERYFPQSLGYSFICPQCGYESSPRIQSMAREVISNHVDYLIRRRRGKEE